MLRSSLVVLAATSAIALSACGSAGSSGAAQVSTRDAKATVERAAGVRLVAQPVAGSARDQGLRASYSNAATAAHDNQAVFLFVLKDAAVAGKVKAAVRSSVPQPSRLIAHGRVLVVYASNGSDHGAQVKQAVDTL
jgi:hypothetical protein